MEWIEGERPGSHALATGCEFPYVVLEIIFQVETYILTSMDTEDLVIYDDTQCQKVEHVRKIVPDIRISVFP